MFTVSEEWRFAFPGACAGVLAMHGVENPAHHLSLEGRKADLEQDLRARYAGYDRPALAALPTLQAYDAYYRRFKKTYHVSLQLESLVLKGRPLPGGAALVEAMFMAELNNLLLTAGHDLAALELPVRVEVAASGERYVVLRGQEQELKPGDMYMADGQGIISSVLYGPDQRTQITPHTRRVMFAVYAPAGIEAQAVRRHLEEIQANVRLIVPQAETELLQVFTA